MSKISIHAKILMHKNLHARAKTQEQTWEGTKQTLEFYN